MPKYRLKCTTKPTLRIQEKPIITGDPSGGISACDYLSPDLIADPFAVLRADEVR
jgi:hypothetical protein